MTNNFQLIELYCAVCDKYNTTITAEAQRQSNNSSPKFTDEECITTYVWGIMQQRTTVKSVYSFIQSYYGEWFPDLPSYQAYNKRICYLNDAFKALAGLTLQDQPALSAAIDFMLDSMPIIVANNKRSSSARTAREFCNKGYCASKDMYYYGVKLHILAQSNPGSLPVSSVVSLSAASECDLTIGKQMLCDIHDINVYADKIYRDKTWFERLLRENNIKVFTPIKLAKGQPRLSLSDKLFSEAVSSIRQPIESLFSWLQAKTCIQHASFVRSLNGLFSFIFARIVSVCLSFNC